MSYYDELGIGPQSSAKQIRRAYRALARLLHPDNFQDEARRSLAEKQMQHLNEILDTLTHPPKKQEYDESLIRPARESNQYSTGSNALDDPIPEHWEAPLTSKLRNASMHWFAILCATVPLAAGIWYWTTGNTQAVQSASVEAAPVSTPEPTRKKAPRQSTGINAVNSPGAIVGTGPQSSRSSPVANAAVEFAEPPPLGLPDPSYNQSPAVISPQTFPLPIPVAMPNLSGLWLFVPAKNGSESQRLYTPEYIELLLLEADGKIIGKYKSRYRIPDKPISPQVNFRLEGKAHEGGKTLNLDWSSADGAEGRAVLNRITPNSLEMKWWTSKLGPPGTLASGSSQLIRQQNR